MTECCVVVAMHTKNGTRNTVGGEKTGNVFQYLIMIMSVYKCVSILRSNTYVFSSKRSSIGL